MIIIKKERQNEFLNEFEKGDVFFSKFENDLFARSLDDIEHTRLDYKLLFNKTQIEISGLMPEIQKKNRIHEGGLEIYFLLVSSHMILFFK